MKSGEAIGKVIADLKAGRVVPVRSKEPQDKAIYEWAKARVYQPVIIDCTAIYRSLAEQQRPVYLYEDHQSIAPPWDEAAFCYVNEHGNVNIMHSRVDNGTPNWETAEPVEWDRVRWRLNTVIWAGGRTGIGTDEARPIRTHGPRLMWQYAIYEDGTPADIHWVDLHPEYPMANWDMAQLVHLGALDFLNARNCEAVEPARPRAETRAIERTGERVREILVFPPGKHSASGRKPRGLGTPIGTVRGSFGHYGACCPTHDEHGLLFGKYAGRFWRPGRVVADDPVSYRLEPETTRPCPTAPTSSSPQAASSPSPPA